MKVLKKIFIGCLVAFGILSLAACKKTNQSTTTTNSQGGGGNANTFGDLENGLFLEYKEDNTFKATRAETRQNAYTAYSPDGAKIGDFITIASAINKCVEYDTEHNAFGSYVTKKDSARTLFKNKQGFDSGNDDQFWYYENGTALSAYNCWDSAGSILTLQNTNLIAHKVSGYGTVSQQTWNSYQLLDAFGETITDVSAQSWELSSAIDAAVMQFPARLSGITGMAHTIDLSGVTITPPYDGADNTYAFMGYYVWQDYYVIAIGIACDTRTGNWHPFIGTSRDDSFSDVEYNLGKCLFTSTYENGSFKPNATTVELSIQTIKLHDEQEDEDYQVDDFKVKVDSKDVYERHITDSLVNNFFSGCPLSWENGYVFIAGLDIKNKIVQNQFVENTDYFNGSEFLGLKVTSAKAYVASKEEISDVTYGYPIEESWRGRWHDILMANTEDTADVLDYNIINTSVCASYQNVNGADVYNFSYDQNNVSSVELGAALRQYQSKIDELGAMALSDILNDTSLLDEVGSWLVENQTIVPQKYFRILDFTGYYQAKELLESSSMSEDAKAVVQELKQLEASDYAGFDAIIASTYAALPKDEQDIVRLAFGAKLFDNLKSLSDFAKALDAITDKFVTYDKLVYVASLQMQAEKNKEMTAKEALEQLIYLANGIASKRQWSGDENDDNNQLQTAFMNVDNHFFPSMRIVAIIEFFESKNLELPKYISDLLETIGYEDFYNGVYYPILNTVKLALSITENDKDEISDLTQDELKFLNEVWTGDYVISQIIVWNWESGNKFQTYYNSRTRAIAILAEGDVNKPVKDYFKVISDFLKGCGFTAKTNGWGVTETEIK